MRFAGPTYVLYNHTSDCVIIIDTERVEDNIDRDLTCTNENSKLIEQLPYPYHMEMCVITGVTDAQQSVSFYKYNGITKIYCYKNHLVIGDKKNSMPRIPIRIACQSRYQTGTIYPQNDASRYSPNQSVGTIS